MVNKKVPPAQLAKEVSNMIVNLKKEINRTATSSTRKAGSSMVSIAKKMSPRLTGETEGSITGYKSARKYIVQSKVNRTFKQNVFADGRIRGGTFRKGKTVSYSMVHRTGITPNGAGEGFYTQAFNKAKEIFENLVFKDISTWELIK